MWVRHGRLRAWLLEAHGEADRCPALPERERELVPLGDDTDAGAGAGDLRLPAWLAELPATPVAVLSAEEVDPIHRHLGAVGLFALLGRALLQLRDDLRAHALAVIGDDDDVPAEVEDELAMPPHDDVIVLTAGRAFALHLPRRLLDEILAHDLEPRPLVSWSTVLPRAARHYGAFLEERAGREVPYEPAPPRPVFRAAAAPAPEIPSVEERRRWLADELFATVFPGAKP